MGGGGGFMILGVRHKCMTPYQNISYSSINILGFLISRIVFEKLHGVFNFTERPKMKIL